VMGMEASASLLRLPKYLAYLKIRQRQGVTSISSTKIAEDLRQSPVQVRKDLALASSAGRPKTGYPMDTLIADLERFLGYHNTNDAFLIGAGHLGRALLSYQAFGEYGVSILAAFDTDKSLHGTEVDGKPVLPVTKLPDLARRMRVQIGILAVPETEAQSMCDLMTSCGIRAIWNFTVQHLEIPEGVIVRDENLAASFAILSKQLSVTIENETLKGGRES